MPTASTRTTTSAGPGGGCVYDRIGAEGRQQLLKMSRQAALLAGDTVDSHEFHEGFRHPIDVDHLIIQIIGD